MTAGLSTTTATSIRSSVVLSLHFLFLCSHAGLVCSTVLWTTFFLTLFVILVSINRSSYNPIYSPGFGRHHLPQPSSSSIIIILVTIHPRLVFLIVLNSLFFWVQYVKSGFGYMHPRLPDVVWPLLRILCLLVTSLIP
ncbi:hypothetical protein K474DRAFT_651102 [Panus rudis PR-1116 ss-1]|nr:hypothetical protein K474DRAFT_651102 [Panus rudis PR-1116 ss-1]